MCAQSRRRGRPRDRGREEEEEEEEQVEAARARERGCFRARFCVCWHIGRAYRWIFFSFVFVVRGEEREYKGCDRL